MEPTEEDQQMKFMNEEPEKLLPYFNPFDIGLRLLAAYGWWALGALFVSLWAYDKFMPKVEKWKEQREDAMMHKDPDAFASRMEAIEAARIKQQKAVEVAAKELLIKEQARQEKKRQQYIDRNEGKSGGNRLGARSEYLPLCGAGTSGGYKAPKKSKCGGGGCGK